MKNIKAVLAGSLFIIIVILLIQLANVFLVVGYNFLAKSLPFLNEIRIYFRYFVGYPLIILVLFGGGYITAAISKKNVFLHCFVVGFVTVSISTLSALDYMTLTIAGVVMGLVALLVIMAGGLFWQRKQRV